MKTNNPNTSKDRGNGNSRKYPRVYARVSEAERAKIEVDAAGLGLSVGGYLRWLAIENPQTRPLRRALPDVELLAQLKGQVGRIGINLNQLLRLANSGEICYSEEIPRACKDVRDLLAYIRDVLQEVEP